MSEVMTPEEFAEKMMIIATMCDPEARHVLADILMESLLIDLGYESGIEIFQEMTKLYA